jgi:hypothetical protein
MSQSSSARPLGGNLVLASLLAVLSYVPFEWVAKGSLVFCAFLFIVDPIPPISRLISVLSLFIVYGLTKFYNQHLRQQQLDAQEVTLVSEETDNKDDDPTATSHDKKTE